jgi:hypothetical protein
MSQKQNKRLRRAINKQASKIKIQGLQEFVDFAQNQTLKKRIIFALRVIFKKMDVTE